MQSQNKNLNAATSASRLSLLSGCILAIGLLTSDTSLQAAPFWQNSDQPNIIVIYTDDQGFGDTSYLNTDAKFKTPNMDRLAREGISFTNGHSGDAVCSPSRYALLTGRYCWRTRLKQNVLKAETKCLITDDRVTLASFLRDNGYDTAMVGKWHLGMDFPGKNAKTRDWTKPVLDMPLDKGFDYFFGIPASLNFGVLAWFEGRHAAVPPTVFTAKKPNKRHNDYRIKPPYQDTPEETRELLNRGAIEVAPDFIDNQCLTRFTDKAIDWMQAKTNQPENSKPFFLYLPLTSPHYPVCPLPEFWGQGQCGGYGEFMLETDYHVGRILEFLKTSGLDESTMIVFSSDNGPETSWKKRIKEFQHHSSGIYRGGKRDIYEGGHRVPMFVRWPAGIKNPGRDWNKPVGQIDLLATVAELIKKPLPEGAAEDSHSFAQVLTNPNFDYDRLPLINHSIGGRFSVTEGDWKLIFPEIVEGKVNKKVELYDLGSDPAESKNLAAEHPHRVDALTKQATDIVINGRTTAGPVQKNDTDYWEDLNWLTAEKYRSRQQAVEIVPSN